MINMARNRLRKRQDWPGFFLRFGNNHQCINIAHCLADSRSVYLPLPTDNHFCVIRGQYPLWQGAFSGCYQYLLYFHHAT